MKILFLHGWHSVPGGVKPTYLKDHGHVVINPKLDDDDFDAAVRTAQAEYDQHQPNVIVGSSRGGAVALNLNSGDTPLVLLCPAWKRWETVQVAKEATVILHSRADDVIPFADSEELVRISDLPPEALIEVGTDHRLANPEPLAAMLFSCERLFASEGISDRPGVVARHEAAHALAAYRYRIPYTGLSCTPASKGLDLDSDAINGAYRDRTNEELNVFVDVLCAMTRIAWLVDTSISRVQPLQEWNNAGSDIANTFKFIRTLFIERVIGRGITVESESLDNIYLKFINGGHRLALETIRLPSFPSALEAVTIELETRGSLSDHDVARVIESRVGRRLLVSESLSDHLEEPDTNRRKLCFIESIRAVLREPE